MSIEQPIKTAFEADRRVFVREKGDAIYARVRVKGKLTWRSTGTNEPRDARQWLQKWRKDAWCLENGIEPKGVVLQRQRVTVAEIIEIYTEAGCPTSKMGTKAAYTVKNELAFLKPVRAYFGETQAASLTLADCDKYLAWRTSGGYVAKFTVRGRPQTKVTKGGKRAVDLELVVLGNALGLAVRRAIISANPLVGRGRYTCASEVRHCREVAPTPEGLAKIVAWLRARKEQDVADFTSFLAFSGLRIGEGTADGMGDGGLAERNPPRKARETGHFFLPVPILHEEMKELLRDMQGRAVSYLLFPSPFDPKKTRDASAIRHRLKAACKALNCPT